MNSCATCRNWHNGGDNIEKLPKEVFEAYGFCHRCHDTHDGPDLNMGESPLLRCPNGELETHKDFGCVLHEPKEQEAK